MDQIVTQSRQKMEKAFEVLQADFATVRTGKASPSLVENIIITAYGGSAHLKVLELATIHAQDAQTIVITPFDKSVIHEIEKGITDAKVGFNPIVDGEIIRIAMPPLTQERREEFVKLANQKAENGRIMVRQIRHEAMEDIKRTDPGEDEERRLEKEVQKATDDYIAKIDTLRREKEEELMRI